MKKKLSFCIPCKDRVSYIKQTLPVNLRHNRDDRNDIEFVLVDFASEDGLTDWVLENFISEINSGYLSLYYTDQMPGFHMSVAKNTAHAFATGKVLTSLDADNFTGPRGGRYVYNIFRKYNFDVLLHQFSGTWRDGTSGRVSYNRDHFNGVAGYDEEFEPYGYDEIDLINRICGKYSVEKVSGVSNRLMQLVYRKLFKSVSHPRYNRSIKSLPDEEGERKGHAMGMRNYETSLKNLAAEKYVANNGKFGIGEGVFKYVDGKFVECS